MKLTTMLLGLALTLARAAAQDGTTGWTLVWADEFSQPDGSAPDPAKWGYDIGAGGWGNQEWQYYTSRTNNARIENGHLVIEARAENYMGSSYTSARLLTRGKWSWTYGRIEARLKVPRGQGIWPAFWMLGTNISSPGVGWPNCGEIDIMENIGKEPTQVHGTVHGPGYSGESGIGGGFTLPGGAEFAEDFHVFAVEWTTNRIRWFVDGMQYFTITPERLPNGANWVFDKPQFLLMNVAVGGIWPGYPDGTTVFPQRMTVDYVRVYAPTPLDACLDNGLLNPGFETGSLANWTTYGAGFNTLKESINPNITPHDGTNVFKVFGQFSGGENYSGVLQDVPVTPETSYTAHGWAFTPDNDKIAGGNSAWVEVSFRDSGANVLSLYRSATITASSLAGAWLQLPVTNQLNPANSSVIGSVSELVAPAGATFARCQVVFRQPASAAGAVWFDDLCFAPASTTGVPVSTVAALMETNLHLSFPTYLNLPYQVRWKGSLNESEWQAWTNLPGNGAEQSLTLDLDGPARFFQVTRLCQ